MTRKVPQGSPLPSPPPHPPLPPSLQPSSSFSSVAQAFHDISTAAEGDDPASTLATLTSELVQLVAVDQACADRYHDRLKKALEEKGEVSG